MKTFRLLPILILLTFRLGAQMPEEAQTFTGAGLRLYPLGWSSEGRWGALASDNSGQIRLLIIDAVTDEILFRSVGLEWDGPDSFDRFWSDSASRILQTADSFNLELSRADIRGPRFTAGTVSYQFVMDPPSPATEDYTLSVSSSRGDAKTVYRSTPESDPEWTVLLGTVISPYEQRALAVLRENGAYRFVGAHLTLGFSRRAEDSAPASAGGLISAVMNGQEYLLRSRLTAGGNPDENDERGYNTVLAAARLGHWRMVRDLAQAGASVDLRDDRGRTALHYAAFFGETETVQVLLKAGADPALRDNAGRSAAELAPGVSLKNMISQEPP